MINEQISNYCIYLLLLCANSILKPIYTGLVFLVKHFQLQSLQRSANAKNFQLQALHFYYEYIFFFICNGTIFVNFRDPILNINMVYFIIDLHYVSYYLVDSLNYITNNL